MHWRKVEYCPWKYYPDKGPYGYASLSIAHFEPVFGTSEVFTPHSGPDVFPLVFPPISTNRRRGARLEAVREDNPGHKYTNPDGSLKPRHLDQTFWWALPQVSAAGAAMRDMYRFTWKGAPEVTDPNSAHLRDFKVGYLDGIVRKRDVLEYFDLVDGRIPKGVYGRLTHTSQIPRLLPDRMPREERVQRVEEPNDVDIVPQEVGEQAPHGDMNGEVTEESKVIVLMRVLRIDTQKEASSSSENEKEGAAGTGSGSVTTLATGPKGAWSNKGAPRKRGPIQMSDEAAEAVRGFKKRSTQVPATADNVASGAFNKACLSEWAKNIVGNDVFSREVTRKEVKAVVKMGWRLTWKEQEGKPRKLKARFFGKGFTDHQKVDTYVGIPLLWVIATMTLFCVSIKFDMDAADVTAAFLTSKDHNRERIRALIPDGLPVIPEECPFEDVTAAQWAVL
uniref:Reverse transcriptase Ty1/copia-type domain-containing protein n=1 Tax=Chromera velia CCMP2878 TaxID=1169474 RepID=A0A0G4FA12_9ALVE|eukprot:Cvel_15960.t1-p1 / transcript=Cvel_15960.t1 / gene=Cvel_15960 / organism=Chromera_velia_CCMP2878 / gene_product=hypothetical protein / transcript_product=hypothetical protein / location=Cvel_scaffold1207:25929-28060(+) / protein_length=448 / sequence_SO=supercontig / SO=protein_coding / is_pseudo=false